MTFELTGEEKYLREILREKIQLAKSFRRQLIRRMNFRNDLVNGVAFSREKYFIFIFCKSLARPRDHTHRTISGCVGYIWQ